MWHRATILSRTQLSPTVTGLKLRIVDHHPTTNGNGDGSYGSGSFTFLPGQWVDFRPLPSSTWKPAGKTIGGYSITSITHTLPELELAVQTSRHPVARWITSHAQPDDLVDVRVGGTFTYDNQAEGPTNQRLLFVTGGVGINPLFSMIRQWHLDHTTTTMQLQCNGNSRAVLLYSCVAAEDFLFKNELEKLIEEKPDQFQVICTTTTQNEKSLEKSDDIDEEECTGNESEIGGSRIVRKEGRIDSAMITEAIGWLNRSSDNAIAGDGISLHEENIRSKNDNVMIADAVFVCGPPGMPESITKILSEDKLVKSTDDVHFEKWW